MYSITEPDTHAKVKRYVILQDHISFYLHTYLKRTHLNKAIITKYKTEFDWWLNSGALLVKSKTSGNVWIDAPNNYSWNDIAAKIIIDDTYVELRKAEVESRTIELNDGSKYCPNWNKTFPDKTPFETYPLELYRIKPEPKFKIGDWITTVAQDGLTNFRALAQVTESDSCQIANGICFNNYTSSLEEAEAWKPKLGEWCIFWNKIEQYYLIARFDRQDNHIQPYIAKHGLGRFNNIAPLEFTITLKNQ